MTAASFFPSPSNTTRSSSPSTIVSMFPIPVAPFFPFSFSTHFFASSCVLNLINTIPRAAPFALLICGSNDTIGP